MNKTYTVGLLVTSLQVNTGTVCNSAVLKVHAVVTAYCPSLTLLVTAWHKMSDASQNVLMDVAFVTGCDHDKVNIESLLSGGRCALVLAAIVADVQTDAVVSQVLNTLHSSVVEKPLWPVLLALVLETLSIQLGVEVLEQLNSDDTIVGSLVKCNSLCAELRILGVDVVCSVRVKDLINTRKDESEIVERGGKHKSLLTKASRHLVEVLHP